MGMRAASPSLLLVFSFVIYCYHEERMEREPGRERERKREDMRGEGKEKARERERERERESVAAVAGRRVVEVRSVARVLPVRD